MATGAVCIDAVVVELCRAPALGRVAGTALFGCDDMTGTLAACCCSIVAGVAGAEDLRVIDLDGWFPGDGIVTGVTAVCGGDMSGRFSGRQRLQSAVAAGTGADCLGMVEKRNRPEGRCGMAGFADVSGVVVGGGFSDGADIVVTLDTVSCHIQMVERSADEANRVVAVTALAGGGNMSGRFADCRGTVVTTAAYPVDFIVIDECCGNESYRCMACFTAIAGVDVRDGFAAGIGAVVTIDAVGRRSGMIKGGADETRGVVAGAAGTCSRNVSG